jgi:hypothetical protein
LVLEKKQKYEAFSRKRKEFKRFNDLKKREKDYIKDTEVKENRSYQYNYFPFTHGDEIEKRRKNQKSLLKTVRPFQINIRNCKVTSPMKTSMVTL